MGPLKGVEEGKKVEAAGHHVSLKLGHLGEAGQVGNAEVPMQLDERGKEVGVLYFAGLKKSKVGLG